MLCVSTKWPYFLMPRWNKQTKREENVSQRTGEFPLQNVSWSLFSRREAVVTYSKHGPWIFDDNFDVQWTNCGALFPDPKMKQTNKKWRKMCHNVLVNFPSTIFSWSLFSSSKEVSTAHMVRDRSHEWQWTNCGALYPDPKMQQTNNQKRRKMCHKVLENFPYTIISWSLFWSGEEVFTYSTHGRR